MTKIVEKVARALAARGVMEPDSSDPDSGLREWEARGYSNPNNAVDGEWPGFVDDARAAIAAMEEPTEEMIGDETVADLASAVFTDQAAIFTAMIQAALKETT